MALSPALYYDYTQVVRPAVRYFRRFDASAFSSWLFLTNAWGYYRQRTAYDDTEDALVVAYVLMWATSLYLSLLPARTPTKRLLDTSAIANVVVRGGTHWYTRRALYTTSEHAWITTCIAVCTCLFGLGYRMRRWCFDPDTTVADRWHACVHVAASAGHHGIALR